MGKKIDYFTLFTNIKYTKKPSNEPLLDEFEVDFVYKNHNMGYFFFPPKSENKTEEDIKKEFEELIRNGKLKKYADNYYGHKKILVPLISLLIAGAIAGASVGTYFALKGNAEPAIKTYNFDFDGGTTCQIDGSYTKHESDIEEGTVLNYTIQIVEPTIHHPLTDVKVTINDNPVTKGTDYTFDGNTGAFSITMKGNVKVVANAELMTFNVTFHHIPDPESGEKPVDTVIPVQAGGHVSKDKHDFTGHHLVGYYSDDKFGEPFKFEDAILKNTDVYVQYLLNEYDVTWSDWDGKELKDPEKCKYGKVPTPPADPTREPDEYNTYEFAGWSPAIGEIKEDTNFIAQYTPTEKIYTLTLDLNGGSWKGQEQKPEGSYDTQFKDLVDSEIEESIDSPEGKYLAGWTYTQDDKDTLIDDEECVFHSDVTPPPLNVTIYAYYELIDYSFTIAIDNCKVNDEKVFTTTFNMGDSPLGPFTITADENTSVPEQGTITSTGLETSEYTYSPASDNKSATLILIPSGDKMPSHNIRFDGEGIRRYFLNVEACENVTVEPKEYYYKDEQVELIITTEQDKYSVPLEDDIVLKDTEGNSIDFTYNIEERTGKTNETKATLTFTFPAADLSLTMSGRKRFFLNAPNLVNTAMYPSTMAAYYHESTNYTFDFASKTETATTYSVPSPSEVTVEGNANAIYTYRFDEDNPDDNSTLLITDFNGEAGTSATIAATGRQRCQASLIDSTGATISSDKDYYHAGEQVTITLGVENDGHDWLLPDNEGNNYFVTVKNISIESLDIQIATDHKSGSIVFTMPYHKDNVGPIKVRIKTVKLYYLDVSGISNLDSSLIATTTPYKVGDPPELTIKEKTVEGRTYSTPTVSTKYNFTDAHIVDNTFTATDAQAKFKLYIDGNNDNDNHSVPITAEGIARYLINDDNLKHLSITSGDEDGYHHAGEEVILTLTPDTNYGVPVEKSKFTFSGISADDVTYTYNDRASATLKFTMPSSDVSISAAAAKQYFVDIDSSTVANLTFDIVNTVPHYVGEDSAIIATNITAINGCAVPFDVTSDNFSQGDKVTVDEYIPNADYKTASLKFTINDEFGGDDDHTLLIQNLTARQGITFDTTNVKNLNLTPAKSAYYAGDVYEANVTAKDGYTLPANVTFKVTYNTSTIMSTYEENKLKFTVPSDATSITITAAIYNITFDPNGGNWSGDVNPKVTTYDAGATVVVPTDNPTHAATDEFTYTFSSWSPTIGQVTGDKTYYATWSTTVREYEITWNYKDANGDETSTKTNVAYGSMPTPPSDLPQYSDDFYIYTFATWSPQITDVTGATTYTAQYTQNFKKYKVIWKNYDGTVLETDENVGFGSTPTYDDNAPTKKDTETGYEFTWTGWTPAVTPATGTAHEIVYTATFDDTVSFHFQGINCTVNGSYEFTDASYHYGQNADITYTITPDIGYHFEESVEYTAIVGVDTSVTCTFTLNDDGTITMTFPKASIKGNITFVISAKEGL